jgi:hypothetical protein
MVDSGGRKSGRLKMAEQTVRSGGWEGAGREAHVRTGQGQRQKGRASVLSEKGKRSKCNLNDARRTTTTVRS